MQQSSQGHTHGGAQSQLYSSTAAKGVQSPPPEVLDDVWHVKARNFPYLHCFLTGCTSADALSARTHRGGDGGDVAAADDNADGAVGHADVRAQLCDGRDDEVVCRCASIINAL